MKLSDSTVNYLKNFSTINSGIVFQEGSVIRTISKGKNILAKATITETITDKFAIYDLNRFLSLIGSLPDPSIEVYPEKKNIKIKSSGTNTLYGLSDESLVVSPPAKEMKIVGEVQFKITKDAMAQVLKLAGILSLPNIAVRGDRSKISIAAVDVNNPDSDVFWIEVGETTAEFDMIFVTENFKMISGEYNVSISSKGISHFANTKEPLEYWIAIEAGSKYAE